MPTNHPKRYSFTDYFQGNGHITNTGEQIDKIFKHVRLFDKCDH